MNAFNLLNHLQSCLATAVGPRESPGQAQGILILPRLVINREIILQGRLEQLVLLPQVVARGLPLILQVLQLVELQPPVRLGLRLQVDRSYRLYFFN